MKRIAALSVLLAALIVLGCGKKGGQQSLGAQPALSPPNPIYLVDGVGPDASLLGNAGNPIVVSSTGGKLGSAVAALSPPNPVYLTDNTSGALASLLGTAANPIVVTGSTTPSGNVGGDLSGSLPDASVAAISGTSPIVITPANLQWSQATVAPQLSQAQQANASNPQTITVAPQVPGAGAASTATGTPGSFVVNLGAPVSTGTEAFLQFNRAGGFEAAFQQVPGPYTALFMGPGITPNATTNATLAVSGAGAAYFNSNNTIAAIVNFSAYAWLATGNGIQMVGGTPGFGGGVGVIGVTNAGTLPTTNPSGGGILYSTGGAETWRGTTGAVTTVAVGGSAGTVNSQHQILDQVVGTAETVSSASATAIATYTTASGSGGQVRCDLSSRAATAGACGAIDDTSASTYVFSYKNHGGTVTLSTAGPTLISGSNQTTAAALAAPVLTATVATNVITFKVTNVALCTIDSQISCSLAVN
jgi:hypothetical protein